jgi:hypothetical protein
MKRNSILRSVITAILCILLIPLLDGQKPVIVNSESVTFSNGQYDGFTLVIPEVSYDEAAKAWIKVLEKGSKSKVVIENGEYSIQEAQISDIREQPLSVFSILSMKDSSILVKVAFEIDSNVFISRGQSEKEFAQATQFLFEFGKEQYTNLAEKELKAEEKTQNSLEKELESLQNAKTRLEKTIVDEEVNILGYNDKITLLKQDAQNLNNKIGVEKNTLMNLSDEEAIKAKESDIKDLEKSKDKVLKEIENLQKDIVESNAKIDRSKLDIESNIRDQSAKMAEIDKQKVNVSKAKNKLDAILNF